MNKCCGHLINSSVRLAVRVEPEPEVMFLSDLFKF